MLICQTYLHTRSQIFPSKTEMICFQIDQREYQVLNSSMLGSRNETDTAASSREEWDCTCWSRVMVTSSCPSPARARKNSCTILPPASLEDLWDENAFPQIRILACAKGRIEKVLWQILYYQWVWCWKTATLILDIPRIVVFTLQYIHPVNKLKVATCWANCFFNILLLWWMLPSMHHGCMIITCSLGGELRISSSVWATSSYFLPYLIMILLTWYLFSSWDKL